MANYRQYAAAYPDAAPKLERLLVRIEALRDMEEKARPYSAPAEQFEGRHSDHGVTGVSRNWNMPPNYTDANALQLELRDRRTIVDVIDDIIGGYKQNSSMYRALSDLSDRLYEEYIAFNMRIWEQLKQANKGDLSRIEVTVDTVSYAVMGVVSHYCAEDIEHFIAHQEGRKLSKEEAAEREQIEQQLGSVRREMGWLPATSTLRQVRDQMLERMHGIVQGALEQERVLEVSDIAIRVSHVAQLMSAEPELFRDNFTFLHSTPPQNRAARRAAQYRK